MPTIAKQINGISRGATMNTKARIHCAGQTYFVVLKEKTSTTGFYDEACYEYYLLRLLNCLNVYQVKLHAYLLQSKQVWLLVTPGTPTALDALLRFLNQCYNNYFNVRFERSARVWSDAAIICSISGDKLVLDCQKFVEREALKTGYVSHPGEYLWSSYCANSFGNNGHYLTPHGAYTKFLNGKSHGLSQYREFIARAYTPAYYLYLKSRLLSGISPQKKRINVHLHCSKTKAITRADRSSPYRTNA